MIVFSMVSCGFFRSSKSALFQSYTGNPMPDCFDNFEGTGQTGLLDFLSWGCFTYKTDFDCLDKFYLQDSLIRENDTLFLDSNRIFNIYDCNEFPKDLSFYQKAIDENIIKASYECENKILIKGIRFPYAHYILYDTITFEVVHLVSGVRE